MHIVVAMKKWILPFILLLAVNLSCQPARQNDPFVSGFEKIDQGNYDEAIHYFSDMHSKDPNNPKIKMALASAYAGSAGLKIDRFWNFAKEMRGPAITSESLKNHPFYLLNKKNIEPFESIIPIETKADLDQAFLLMSGLDTYRTRAQIYPYVKKDRRPDVEKAVAILNAENNQGASLYRAILNGVLLRSDLDDGFDFWNSVGNPFAEFATYPLEFERIFCTPVTGPLTVWMNQQFERIVQITLDLKKSYPSDGETYSAYSAPLQTYQTELPKLQAKLIPSGCPK